MKAGWEAKTIGEVCDVMNGGTPKTGVKEFWDGEHQWITPAEMGKRASPYVSKTERQITDKGLGNSSAKLMPPQSVIMSSRAPIGHLVINEEPMAFNQGCKGLTPRDSLNNKYLYYYLFSKVDLLNSLGTGATFKELSGAKLKDVPIPVAPLLEQQRIVTILDQAFEGIATATANAEKNLSNARELFESELQSVFSKVNEVWTSDKLSSVTSKIGSGATPLGGEGAYKDKGISLIRSLNVYDRHFRFGKLAYIDNDQADKLSNVVVQRSDVLFNITGASVARCCVVPDKVLPARVNQHVSIIRPISDKLNAKFLQYALTSKPYKDKLLQTGEKGGATRQAITKAQLQEFRITYPKSIQEQQIIVAQLDELFAETKKLEAIYQQKVTVLEELKKSILNQAFSGQLN